MSIKDEIRNIFKVIESHHLNCFARWRKRELLVVEWKNVIARRDEWRQDLSKDQKRKVDAFFKEHYGKKIPYFWHRMYTNYTGIFDEKYFPEILFSTELEEKLNPYTIAFPLQNKAFNPQQIFRNLWGGG